MTAFIGSSIITAQITWRLVENCAVQSTGQDAVQGVRLAFAGAAAGPAGGLRLIVVAILLAVFGLSWRSWAPSAPTAADDTAKAKITIVAGVPSCWPPC